FAPITLVEVERSFSRYKSILRLNRRSFNFENLKMYVVSHCSQDQDQDEYCQSKLDNNVIYKAIFNKFFINIL
ncbi:Uncharacterized protein FWK35_00013086, partial [Aphis craccivora]